ncbi:MAG: shufflon system plasmid conjugative transfer pilus tip adhesin PilV, partial [Burkholderiaceae bacterium]
DSSLEDSKGQQAALYQSQVVAAATKYINDFTNYSALTTSATPTVTAIDLAALKTQNYLPASFAATNPYGQAPCVLAQQQAANPQKLDVLIITTGGQQIDEKNLAAIAAGAGTGGGYIKGTTTQAQGTAWALDNTALGTFTATMCAGLAAPTSGHLASAIFFDGPGQLSTDFLYRSAIPGRPELNTMNAPLLLNGGFTANGTSHVNGTLSIPTATAGSACTAAGEIASDTLSGAILSCQGGLWSKQSGSWKDPVANFASLPLMGNQNGDVRATLDKSLAFMWNTSTGWVATGVDDNGNLTVPNALTTQSVKFQSTVIAGSNCATNGAIATDAAGSLLSCRNAIWRDQAANNIGAEIFNWTNPFGPSPAGTAFDFPVYISSLTGTPPFYITAQSQCESIDNTRSFISYQLIDNLGRTVGYTGECGALSDATSGRVFVKSSLGLQKIPDNVVYINIHIEPSNYLWTDLHIFSSL